MNILSYFNGVIVYDGVIYRNSKELIDYFFLENKSLFFIENMKLLVGDIVLFFDGKKLVETKILSLIDTKEYIEMYNVEFVKKNHTFFANGVLVHNKS